MKIARIIDSRDSQVIAALQPDGSFIRLAGCRLQNNLTLTDEPVAPRRYPPPIEPLAIINLSLIKRILTCPETVKF